MSDFVDLEVNIPQTVALAYDDGKLTETRFGDKVFFRLVDGRTLSLKPESAIPITTLAIRKKQPFCVCKREGKGAGGKKTNRPGTRASPNATRRHPWRAARST